MAITSYRITNVINTPDTVLWKLPQGIPNEEEGVELGDRLNHSRKICPKSIGRTCWIDVFQYILHGSYPTLSHQEVNKAVNVFRDRLNQDQKIINTENALLKILSDSNDPLLKLPKDQFFLRLQEAIDTFEDEEGEDWKDVASKLLHEFVAQKKTEDFKEFIESYIQESCIKQEGLNSYYSFFESLKISATDFLSQEILQFLNNQKFGVVVENIQDLSLSVQYRIANVVGRQSLAKSYGFSPSSWSPLDKIDILIEEVRNHGVVGFGGVFGRASYSNCPHQVANMGGYKIYGWTPSERNPQASLGHFIAVVGAKKQTNQKKLMEGNNGHVIYIDPEDASDPNHPEQQKFYIISYETFKKYVSNEFGLKVTIEKVISLEKFFQNHGGVERVSYGLLPNPPYIL